jgi:hypothetical protein
LDISHTALDAARPGRRAVQVLAVAVLLGVLPGVAGAQPAGSDLVSARSHSGQFVVYAGRSSAPPPPVFGLATNQNFVKLEPTLATVSCERIKQALTRELGAPATWSGAVYLVLHPARAPGDTITITSERFKDCWQYRVDFPDVVEQSRYVRVIVQVLLLEMANRTAHTRAAEIPAWLVEGLSQLLLASSEVALTLSPPRPSANGLSYSTTVVNARKEGFRQQAQKQLHGRPPLSFENLSWPTEDSLSGDAGDLYRGSAQLFVGELFRLPDGRGCVRAMLAQLPQHYNWQFAFLRAFNAFFERPLDVEKWWALSVAQATGRDIQQPWTLEESWQKLNQTIHAVVQVRTGNNELPSQAEITLQTVIREWDSARQTQALQNTLRELELLRRRIDQEFVGLVQDYSQTLVTYLQQRDHAGSVLSTRKAGRRRAVEAAIQQLDALDARREALRPASKPVAPSPTAAPAP